MSLLSTFIMDQHQFLSFPVLFTSFIFIFMVLKICRRSKTNQNLPPGPRKLPIIGNMHNLLGSLPHHRLQDLAKKYGPLMHLQLGEVTTIVISSPEIAKDVMKTNDIIFAQRPFSLSAHIISYESADIAFAPYGGYWRQMRKICMLELLSAKRVQSFRSIREEEVSNLMSSISFNGGSLVNLSKKLFAFTYSVISRAAFGRVREEQEAFVALLKEIMEVGAGFSISDLFPSIKVLQMVSGMGAKMERLHQEADRILENIISDHRSRKAAVRIADEGVDLVDVFLNLQDQENLEFSLSIDNIKSVILDIFIAGSETSSTTAEWAMSEMLRNPTVMEKAQAEVRQVFSGKGHVDEEGLGELNYLKLVVKETLRLHPPLPLLLPRESREQCEINGNRIPIKTKVIVNAWAIGRDPNYWIEAERFNPERFSDSTIDYKGANFEYIPFGAGRRICPGISFGMVNVELPLANLLYHFDWKLPSGMKLEELDMTESFGSVVRRKNDLCLTPTLCHPLPVA
ncbi:hypothetical protein P3X46_006535 [Hevea brasiliensis]|uniref:Cytochrome P450 n=1 Tax=Hevea brasiliensis TaxID=3981 RepID=A0ABQ9MQI5_HEVBR|nr:desmethyl-deoxy-podophyllotoxin synthase-like [Hevea brasiliensis]KAJ9182551.1 hypothetical protein P3X46_006535 [Hevea brasiliensis]